MKRVIIKIGDLFRMKLTNENFAYFQYMMNDETQMGANVIRVFDYEEKEEKSLEEMNFIKIPTKFNALCVIRLGLNMGLWEKMGRMEIPKEWEKPFFRNTEDLGDPAVRYSSKWYVWNPGEDFISIGVLSEEQKKYDIGLVFSPPSIVKRFESGRYNVMFPEPV